MTAQIVPFLRKNLVTAVQRRLSLTPVNSRENETLPIAFVALPRLYKALRGSDLNIELVHASTEAGPRYRAIVIRNLASDNNWEHSVLPWLNLLPIGGYLVTIDRVSQSKSQDVCRKLLCLGISDLQQEVAARRILTSGQLVAKIGLSSNSPADSTVQ